MFNWFNARKKYKEIRSRVIYLDNQLEIALPKPCLSGELLRDAFKNRRSIRLFSSQNLSLQELSNLLWSACGVSLRIESGRMLYTNPTASNHQEIRIFGVDKEGGFEYIPSSHSLMQLFKGDIRSYMGMQEFVGTAPLVLCIVADYYRMTKHNLWKKIRYSCIDAGYVSQNIYLYCASIGLATVACGKIHRLQLKRVLKIKNGDVVLCHPIGEKI